MNERIPFVIPLYVGLSALMLAWNILLAGRIAQFRRAPRSFAILTAMAGLLLPPAALIAFASSSILYGRAIQPVLWLWPIVAVMFLVQAMYALGKGLVTPPFGVPIILYNAVIAAVAVSKFTVSRGGAPPELVHGLAAAQASATGIVFGTAALWKSAYIQIPLLAPAIPAHWRLTAFARVVLGVIAIVMTALVLVEVPDGIAAVRSYPAYAEQRLQERPEGDFKIGLKLFPDLRGPVPPIALRNDTALAHRLEVDVIHIVITPEAVNALTLDSLARAVETFRADSVLLMVSLGYSPGSAKEFRQSPSSYVAARLRDIDRVTRRLRPDMLLPAVDPYGDAERALGIQPASFWIDYLTRAAQTAHHLRPAMRVGVSASSYGSRDSVLYEWAARPGSPMDIVGFSLAPGFDGASTLETRMRIAQRWMRQYPEKPKPHWVFNATGFPAVHGEKSQELTLWGIFAWATSQAEMKGLVVLEAGDYSAERGLRAPTGRLRPAVAAIARARTGLRETAAGDRPASGAPTDPNAPAAPAAP